MRKAVPRLFALLIIPLGVVFLYALVHEASHALGSISCWGEVTRFQVNFLQHAPSISYTGVSDPLHKAFISLAGPVLPLALVPFVAVVLRKTRSALAQAAALLFLLSLLPTALTSSCDCPGLWVWSSTAQGRHGQVPPLYRGQSVCCSSCSSARVRRSAGVCVQGGGAR